MKIKKYLAPTLKEALAKVKEELGEDAIIVNTRTYKDGGIGKLFKNDQVEVTAAIEEDLMPKRNFYAAKAYKTTESDNINSSLEDNKEQALINSLKRFKEELPKMQGAQQQKSVQKRKPAEPITVKSDVAVEEKEDYSILKDELTEMKEMLHSLQEKMEYKGANEFPPIFQKYYKKLIDNEVDEKTVKKIITEVYKEYENKAKDILFTEDDLKNLIVEKISENILTSGHIKIFDDKTSVVFLVGPTGVGKTTTIAKISAIYAIYEKKKVALVTIDTYRLAAVEQLKAFANIVHLPLYTIFNLKDMDAIKRKFDEYDLILIDTAGRSQKDIEKLEELKQYIQTANPTEVHLVLSLTTKYHDLIHIMKKFSIVPINRIIFTKLDETTRTGNILNILKTVKGKISYITTGQDIPDDIELADSIKLSNLIVEGVKDD